MLSVGFLNIMWKINIGVHCFGIMLQFAIELDLFIPQSTYCPSVEKSKFYSLNVMVICGY